MRLIRDGVVDREGVPGLATRLGYSERQIHRTLVAEVGAGPLALARAQRAQTARILLETSDVPAGDVAFAAGFASIRQFNETIQAVFATTPTGLRDARRPDVSPSTGVLDLRLPYRAPMDLMATLEFLGARAIPGVEAFDGDTFTRTLRLPGGPALATLREGGGYVRCQLRLTDQRDLITAVARIRRLLDLDADPVAVEAAFEADAQLAPLARKHSGLRSPGAVDGFEMAVRAIVGQQVSVPGARTLLGRIATSFGTPVFDEWRLFPSPESFADTDPDVLPMPRKRAATLHTVAASMASGSLTLDPGAERAESRAALLELPGIGPWTADYLLMRAVGDPDVLLTGDLGVQHAAESLGIELSDGRPSWAPWRSYATHHLWRTL
jgi:AraC family transcriptional regulator of adaptative response / DNA-3-methyladenine glycosylase II